LRVPLILAPMAGVSDLPFRLLNRRFGCCFAFTEMINVRSLGHKSRKTGELLATVPEDAPLGLQLLAGEEQYLLKAIEVVQQKFKFALIDFNAACPAKKVVRRGEGAALMKDPARLERLVGILAKSFKVPVTVKIRAGWDRTHLNAPEVARRCEDAGVKAVFVHGRTKLQEYSGKVDYEVIAQVKKAVRVPVIGSGDVLSPELAGKMLDSTGCDGVLVARGSFGNPWIFSQTEHYLAHRSLPEPPAHSEVLAVMRDHLDSCIAFYGPRVAVTIYRKFFAWYTKGMRGARPLREKANTVRTAEGLRAVIDECRVSHI
jgi:tRNA-dihydrouridine synthase B